MNPSFFFRIVFLLLSASPWVFAPDAAGAREKLDPSLAALVEHAAEKPQAAADALRRGAPLCQVGQMVIDDLGRVQVYLYVTRWDDSARAALLGMGASIEIEKPALGVVQCSLPVEALPGAATLDWVDSVRRPSYGITMGLAGRADSASNTTLHQGERWPRLPALREELGWSGEGVSVGVISDGIKRLAESQAAGELPTDVTAQSFRADHNLEDGGEGTAILEQTYDSVPGAQLYFANSGTDLEFVEAVSWLCANCDYVACDVGYFGMGPLDGSGLFDRSLAEAIRAASSFTASAGNQGRSHWRGTYWDPDGNGWHNFAAEQEYITCAIDPGGALFGVLSWDDHASHRGNPYSMQVRSSTGAVLGNSTPLSGAQGILPSDLLFLQNPTSSTAFVRVFIKGGGCAPRMLHFHVLGNYGGSMWESWVPQDSVHNVTVAEGVHSTGAYDMNTACTVDGASPGDAAIAPFGYSLEMFSSHGWTPDGRRVPDVLFPDRIDVFSEFWTWGKASLDYEPTGGFGGTSGTVASGAAIESYWDEAGNYHFVVENQHIKLPHSILENLNDPLDVTGSDGFQLYTTAGAEALDTMDLYETMREYDGVEFEVTLEPERLELVVEPLSGASTTLRITNPHPTLPARGKLRFNGSLLRVIPPVFEVSPGGSVDVTVESLRSLAEGHYSTSIEVGHYASAVWKRVPVEISVERPDAEVVALLAETEPNNPEWPAQIFNDGQEIEVAAAATGDGVTRIEGSIGAAETSVVMNGGDDAEDWFHFRLDKEATLTFTLSPKSPTADLDLYLVHQNGATLLQAADRDGDGRPEMIGPITLGSAWSYAVGVGIYDKNRPNSDGSFEPQETEYTLEIRRGGEPFTLHAFTPWTRADAVVPLADGALFWGQAGLDRTLFSLSNNPWDLVWSATESYFLPPQPAGGDPTRVAVVWDESESTYYKLHNLQIWDFSAVAGPVVLATLTPADNVARRQIMSFSFSRDGSRAVMFVKLDTNRHAVIAFNAATGQELSRVEFRTTSAAARMLPTPEGAVVVVRTYSPDRLTLVDGRDAASLVATASRETGGTPARWGADPGARVIYFVPSGADAPVKWARASDSDWQSLDPGETVNDYLSVTADGDAFLLAGTNSLIRLPFEADGTPGEMERIDYPEIQNMQKSPGKVVHLGASRYVMQLGWKEIWFFDLAEMAGLGYYQLAGTDNIMALAASPDGGRVYIAGMRALAIDVALDAFGPSAGRSDPADEPELTAYPNVLGFSVLDCGVAAAPAYAWVFNTGRVPAQILSIDVPEGFRLESSLPPEGRTVAPGWREILGFVARAGQPGIQRGVVRVHTDDPDDPVKIISLSVSGRKGSTFVAGDVNGDGTRDATDAMAAARFWRQSRDDVDEGERPAFDRCDADFNGRFDAEDLLRAMIEP